MLEILKWWKHNYKKNKIRNRGTIMKLVEVTNFIFMIGKFSKLPITDIHYIRKKRK